MALILVTAKRELTPRAEKIALRKSDSFAEPTRAKTEPPSHPAREIRDLKFGQRHNEHVMELYQRGFETLPQFWTILVFANTWVPDFGELQINLNWQYDNNIGSLTLAHTGFTANDDVRAMRDLMNGQWHNKKVMNLYRSCYRANAPRLKAAVKALINP